jgi:hypothetical protein
MIVLKTKNKQTESKYNFLRTIFSSEKYLEFRPLQEV